MDERENQILKYVRIVDSQCKREVEGMGYSGGAQDIRIAGIRKIFD